MSAPVILGIAGSPRRQGNSETLLDAALFAMTAAAPVTVHKLVVPELHILPCRACDACRSGRCVQRDDMDRLYPLLEAVDGLLVASPVFFMGLPAQLKAVIDRGQLFWNRGPQASLPLRRPGAFIAVGATRGSKLFVGSVQTIRCWFDALGVTYHRELKVRGVDARGAILGEAQALADAQALGRDLAAALGAATG